MKNNILIVDDNYINRTILKKIFSPDFEAQEAENGIEAIKILKEEHEKITAVILDLKMPVMDGYEVLKLMNDDGNLNNIPVIIATGSSDNVSEAQALKLGAWDFITKPYDPDILRFRLKNAIERSKLNLMEKLRIQAEYDELTGLYNTRLFYKKVSELLTAKPDSKFVITRFDIDRFKQINSFYGTSKGDELLLYISDLIKKDADKYKESVYARIGMDVFAICTEYDDEETILDGIYHAQELIRDYNKQFNIIAPFGLYFINDRTLPVNEMLDRAAIAQKLGKGKYIDNVVIYTESMGESIKVEQNITNEMNTALEEKQFCVYYQPKYNIATGKPIGAEALVRWKHPQKGMISPGVFIPTFEKNGFITKVDYYVWEETCKYLRKCIDEGKNPCPVSVNISRMNLSNPCIVDLIVNLVQKYDLEPRLLELEITESAYMDNPEIMIKIVNEFHKNGFLVLMDDFGSGYSSLNTLKDISVDVLKVDMKFLSSNSKNPKSEKILASIIRMAEWLEMKTIVEGVETREQCNFLKSVGCLYVQGFYYARPMPVEDYDQLMTTNSYIPANKEDKEKSEQFDELLSTDSKTLALLSGLSLPVVLYEYKGGRLDRVRVNQCFYDVFGYERKYNKNEHYLEDGEYKNFCAVIEHVARNHTSSECEIKFQKGTETLWFRVHLRYIIEQKSGDIISAVFTNITQEKWIEQKIKQVSVQIDQVIVPRNVMLIIDDSDVSCAILSTMFEDEFKVVKASNGMEGFNYLESHKDEIGIILLDMIMPKMGGAEFLELKNKNSKIMDIPVIVISADKTEDIQVDMLRMGVNDYITKPFVPELVYRRVHNVLEYQNRFKQLLGEFNRALSKDSATVI